MNTALSDTIFYVTGKQGIENATQYELETMIAEYPYFAPAQLVYATKLKSENSFKLQTQTQKAGLFFNNFKWLQYQLMEVGSNNFKAFSSKDYAVAEQIKDVPVAETPVSSQIEPVIAEDKVEDITAAPTEEIPEIVAVEATSTSIHEFMPNMSIPSVEDVKDIMSGIDDGREVVEEYTPATVDVTDEPVAVVTATEPVIEDVEEMSSAIVAEPVIEETIANHIETANEEPGGAVADNKPDIHAEIAALKANWYSHHEEVVAQVPVEEVLDVKVEPVVETVQNFPGVNADLANFKNDWAKPAETLANQPLPFETEPYYTIDYFASQGIKFDYSKEPHDRLTSKMLRFTDWLKKMKTVKPEHEVTMSDDPELDNAIQNIASISNQTKEVVTETMAAIFAKQGKTEKAIQLYIKLSFLIPDKSAYFATQIKELKGI